MKDEPTLHFSSYRMKHLTRYDRAKLEALKRAGHTQQVMAEIIGCSQSAVSRELQRNSSPWRQRYTGVTAQRKAEQRRTNASALLPRWHDDGILLDHVLTELIDGKTPEQITGRLKYQGQAHVISHQTVYAYIRNDRHQGGRLYQHLRYRGKKYKWRGFIKDKMRIPDRRGIEERPPAVFQKERYGDWETDLVVSCKKGSGALATFAERLSRYCRAIKVNDQSADEMVRASKDALGSLPPKMRRTMTHDNGKEICKHKEITKALKTEVYCARPYRSCDRGLNEWMNRELRRFFPKGTDFQGVSQEQVDYAVTWLNNCPRKSLQYRTPQEVFEEQLQIMHLGV